jgi:hypothetical protein
MGAVTEFSGNQIYDSAAKSYLKSRKQNKSRAAGRADME